MSKLDSIIKEINKEYKEEIAFNGNDAELIKYEKVPFSSPRLNYMMYGGLPMGRMIEFAGAERSGKTTTALDMVKQCQIKLAFSPVFLAEFINLCIIIRDNDIIKAVSYTTASMVKGGYT